MKCSFIVNDEIKPFKLRTKGPKSKVKKVFLTLQIKGPFNGFRYRKFYINLKQSRNKIFLWQLKRSQVIGTVFFSKLWMFQWYLFSNILRKWDFQSNAVSYRVRSLSWVVEKIWTIFSFLNVLIKTYTIQIVFFVDPATIHIVPAF